MAKIEALQKMCRRQQIEEDVIREVEQADLDCWHEALQQLLTSWAANCSAMSNATVASQPELRDEETTMQDEPSTFTRGCAALGEQIAKTGEIDELKVAMKELRAENASMKAMMKEMQANIQAENERVKAAMEEMQLRAENASMKAMMEEMQANIQAENERMKAEMDEMQADLQRQRNEVAQHREIVKETIGGMTELADATKKEIDDLTDKMQAELAEVKFCHELSR